MNLSNTYLLLRHSIEIARISKVTIIPVRNNVGKLCFDMPRSSKCYQMDLLTFNSYIMIVMAVTSGMPKGSKQGPEQCVQKP